MNVLISMVGKSPIDVPPMIVVTMSIINPIKLVPIPKPTIILPILSGPKPATKAPTITENPPPAAIYVSIVNNVERCCSTSGPKNPEIKLIAIPINPKLT